MKTYQRSQIVLMLLICMFAAFGAFAQSDITVGGSALGEPLIDALAANAGTEVSATYAGTAAGINQFCFNTLDVVVSSRFMTLPEEDLCNQGGVTFQELVIGYEAVAYIAHPDLSLPQCLSSGDLNNILSPAASISTTWDLVSPAGEVGLSVQVFMPPASSLIETLVDDQTAGVGFRSDLQRLETDSAVIEAVSNTEGAFGVVRASTLTPEAAVTVAEVRNPETGLCSAPSADALNAGNYPQGVQLLIYANATSVTEKAGIAALLAPLGDLALAEPLLTGLYLPPTTSNFADNTAVLAGETGRRASATLTAYQIPATISGTVNIAGNSSGFSLISGLVTDFTTQYTTAVINNNFLGQAAGLQQLCNGEVDAVVIEGQLAEDTRTACAAVDIALVELPLGTQSVVLVANEADEFLACLTPEQIARTWDAATAGDVNTWQAVDASFPDSELTLFAGDLGTVTPNLLLTHVSGGQPLVMRADTETNNDPLYRAAAVANVPGALTYMTWGQYQDVLANNQARIQLVAVGQSNDCVTPSEESLQDGSYPLAQTLSLVISQRALERAEVQAFAWYVNDPVRVADYERQSFEFITPVGLATRQVTLENAFAVAQEALQARQAQEAAATPVPAEEATAEVIEEATAEVTEEATAEVTPTTGE